MTWIADAENAEDIAEAFSKFKVPVSDHAPDITAAISELYGIGSALRDIDTTINSPEYNRYYPLIEKDLDLVCSSLGNTLEDIFRILGDIGEGSRVLNNGMYRQTWKEIAFFFSQNGRSTLRMRLEKYRRFILELINIIKRFAHRFFKKISLCSSIYRRPPRTLLVGGLRGDIQGLIPAQDRPTETLNNMTLGLRGK
jgi:hypothetical protein